MILLGLSALTFTVGYLVNAAKRRNVQPPKPLTSADYDRALTEVFPSSSADPHLPAVSTKIQRELETRDNEKTAILAFLSRKGEEARAKLAGAEAAHAVALSSLESARQTARGVEFAGRTQEHDLLRAKVMEVAIARQQFEYLEIQTKLTREAARRGYSLATDEDLRKKKAEIDHELHRIAETEKINLHTAEETERIKFEYEERQLNAKTESIIRLANTPELVRAQMTSMLDDYIEKRDRAVSDEKRADYQFEIDRLREMLRNGHSGLASEANAGENA